MEISIQKLVGRTNDLIRGLEIVTEYFYRAGVLYTTSDKREGFLAYWIKDSAPAIRPISHMIYKCIKELPISLDFTIMGLELYAKLYKKEPDYVAVSMMAVSRTFQGMEFMYKVLSDKKAIKWYDCLCNGVSWINILDRQHSVLEVI